MACSFHLMEYGLLFLFLVRLLVLFCIGTFSIFLLTQCLYPTFLSSHRRAERKAHTFALRLPHYAHSVHSLKPSLLFSLAVVCWASSGSDSPEMITLPFTQLSTDSKQPVINPLFCCTMHLYFAPQSLAFYQNDDPLINN